MGQNVATSAIINAHVALAGTSRLEIGVRSFVNEGTYFDLAAPTTIGNDCAVGYQVMFVTATHAPGRSSRRAGPPEARPISVGDGTWIGARATILPGVTIGTGCIIAAGSVVTKDCEPNTLYGGVPARRIRALRDDHGNGIEVDE
jgi:maltose O-acetyltransferase